MLFSIISVLVGCSGGEKEATETTATPAATEVAPVTPAVSTEAPATTTETVAPTTEATTEQPTVVVVAK